MGVTRVPPISGDKERIQVDPPQGSRLDVITPDFCRRTTWYEQSTAVEGETLVDSGDGLTFESANGNWIEVVNGKITDERELWEIYKPVIKDDGVVKEESILGVPNQDFQIDYAAGTVTFDEAPTGPVTADYHHENGSRWTVKPLTGKQITLTFIEVQVSTNAQLTNTILFEIWVAGQCVKTKAYQTMQDLINASAGNYPTIPAMGGAAPRGNVYPVQLFRFPYDDRAVTILKSSQLWEARVRMEDDEPCTGEHVVATFYGISEDE